VHNTNQEYLIGVSYTGNVLGQLYYTVNFCTNFYSAVRICTPCWVVWGVRLTLLDFITQTKSRYLGESFKDIDTVRNMVAGCGLFCYLEVYRNVWYTREQKYSVNLHCRLWAQYSGCMYAQHEWWYMTMYRINGICAMCLHDMIATIKRYLHCYCWLDHAMKKDERKYSVPILNTHVPYYFVTEIDCS
jgi:hypothetical protein